MDPERSIFCSPDRQMDHSRHAVLLWTIHVNLFQKLCIIQKGFSLEKVEWKELRVVRAEIETRKYVLGQQKKSTSNERQTEFASPELNS